MYLTDKLNKSPRSMSDHDEVELLLEGHSNQLAEIVNEVEGLVVSVLNASTLRAPLTPLSTGKCRGHTGYSRTHVGFEQDFDPGPVATSLHLHVGSRDWCPLCWFIRYERESSPVICISSLHRTNNLHRSSTLSNLPQEHSQL